MVELKFYAYRKTKDGIVASFVIHPNDSEMFNHADVGTVFEADFKIVEQEG